MSRPIRIAILADGKQARREISGVAKETTLLGKAAGKGGMLLKRGLQAGLAGAAALAGTALVKGFGRLQGIEEAEAKLRGLGHSASSVENIMDNALTSVKGTAFGLDAAATTAAGAVAAGVKPGRQLERTLTLVGDAATIAGTDMSEMGAIFNKVASSDMIQGDVLAQLGDKGIPVLQLLADEMGVAATEVRKMASRGEIDFATFQNAMEKGLGGAAQESGKTLRGAFANAQAALGRLGASALKGAYPQIRRFFQRSITLIDRFGPRAEKAGEAIGAGLAKAGTALGNLFKGADLSGNNKNLAAVRRTAESLWGSVRRLSRSLADLARSMKPAVVDTFRTALDGTLKVAEGLAKVLGSTVVPAVEALSKLIGAIPAPLQAVAIQAGIAALVFPRLAAGAALAGKSMQSASVYARVLALELRDAGTRATLASAATARMGKIARGAAGVGGMVALAQGAQTSNKALSSLANIGGGAMLGFSVGGPIGAAIGGGAGALYSLYDATKVTKTGMEEVEPPTERFRDTLDNLTGAATRATRQLALQKLEQSGAITAANALGIQQRDLIGASLGQAGAIKRVNAAMQASRDASHGDIAATVEAAGAREKLAGSLGAVTSEFNKESRAAKEAKAATDTWREALEGVPRAVRVELRNLNYEPTRKQVLNLQRVHGLTKKQVTTIFEATNVQGSIRAARSVQGAMRDVGKTKANTGPFTTSVLDGLAQTKRAASRQTAETGRVMGRNVSGVKFNPHPLVTSLTGGISSAQGVAASGGSGIGAALANGASAGVRQRAWQVADEARNMVLNAVRAANNAAIIKSPSRKMMKMGRNFALGALVGIQRTSPKVARATRRMVNQMLATADRSGSQGLAGNVEKRLSKAASAAIKADKKRRDAAIKRFNAEHQGAKNAKKREAFEKQQRKAQRQYERAVNQQKKAGVKNLRDEAKALAQNANARKRLNDRLKEEKARLADLRQERLDYIGTIRDTLTAYTSLGNVTEGHMNAPESLLEQMTARVEKAEEWAAMVEKLRKAGLGQASLQQIIDAGVEGGFAQAQAILAGGPQMVTALNALQKRTEAAGTKLGTSLGNQFFNAGIAAQDGLVKGLESDLAKLDKAATRLARQLVRALKKELKIKSPSRVMRGLGVDTGMGMVLGVGDTYAKAKRAGVEVGKAVQSGVSATDLVRPLDPRALLAAGAGARGGQPLRVEITLTAQQVDQLSRGRQIRADLNAWDSVGGRQATP